jgi:hypothetical protein
MKLNFKQIIALYDETDLYQFRTKLINQKRVILILSQLIKLNEAVSTQYISILNLLDDSTSNYEALCNDSGEDCEYLKSTILSLLNWIQGLLAAASYDSKSSFFLQVKKIRALI